MLNQQLNSSAEDGTGLDVAQQLNAQGNLQREISEAKEDLPQHHMLRFFAW